MLSAKFHINRLALQHMNDVTSRESQLKSHTCNINWAESTSEPMKFRLFIDHIIKQVIF